MLGGQIPHLVEMGVTAVEILPVFEYDELEFQVQWTSRTRLFANTCCSTRCYHLLLLQVHPGVQPRSHQYSLHVLYSAGVQILSAGISRPLQGSHGLADLQ